MQKLSLSPVYRSNCKPHRGCVERCRHPEHQLDSWSPGESGMPLAWAHAEYIKLLRSMEQDKVWDMPPQTVQRYQVEQRTSSFEIWTEHEPRQWVSKSKQLAWT